MKILWQYSDYGHTPKRKRLNTYGGIGYYRTIKPSEQVQGHEVKVVGQEITLYGSTLEEQWDNIFKEFDVFWTSYFASEEAAAAIFYHAQKHGKKVIIDVDDNYLDIPESNQLYDRFKPGKKDRAFLSTILSFADAVTVSTEPLKDRLHSHIKEVQGIDKPIYVIPNCNDIKDWNFPPIKKDKDRFVIGYSGSNSHKDDLALVLPAIRVIMQKHPHVWFEILGILSVHDLKDMLGGFTDDMLMRIATVGATATFREYPEWLSKRPWHVGIAPLVDTAFTRSKSHIKWMEYAMMDIPVVASRVYPYYMELEGKETITHGETGYLCKPKDWCNMLDYIITNYDEAEKVGKNAYAFIANTWQYKDSNITDTINKMLSEI
jgi:glycosyltransferase involved in cell wall biosynthesis